MVNIWCANVSWRTAVLQTCLLPSSRSSLMQHGARTLLFGPLPRTCTLSWKPLVFYHILSKMLLSMTTFCVPCFDFVVKDQRLNFVKKWTARRQQLRAAEFKFHKSLHPSVEEVVHKPQFPVLLKMLQDLDFPKHLMLVQPMCTCCVGPKPCYRSSGDP